MNLLDLARKLEPDSFIDHSGGQRDESQRVWELEAKHDLEFQREEIRRDQEAEEAKMAYEVSTANLGPQSQSDAMLTGRLLTAEAALGFILAGNAYFTLRSRRTGTRFTYRVARPKRARENNEDFWYVSLLNGPDNESNYTYMANLKRNGTLRMWTNDKCRVGQDAPSYIAFKYMLEKLMQGVTLENMEIWHEGRCGRCGRRLTVPESVAAGIGPECAGRMGL